MRTSLVLTNLLLIAPLLAAMPVQAGPIEDSCSIVVRELPNVTGCRLRCNDSFGQVGYTVTCLVEDLDNSLCPPSCNPPPIGPIPSLPDEDDDNIPDILESILCGSAAQRAAISASGQGACTSSTNLVLSPDPSPVTGPVGTVIEIVLGIIGLVTGLVDSDGDNIPDESEPALCLLENQNFPQDGSCTGSDYHPYI